MVAKVDVLDFAKLRAFELVAQHGTLQVAAARMNLTVSAVSTQIKRLEEIVGAGELMGGILEEGLQNPQGLERHSNRAIRLTHGSKST